MSLIFATQLTAVFTAILGVGVIVTAVLAGLAFRKQSQEVGLLLEQNKRDTDERLRAQAARVLLGVPPDTGPPVSPYARNASDLPVYEATIRYTGPARIPDPEHLGAIMPGDTAAAAELFSSSQALKYAVLTFRDAAGIHWVRWRLSLCRTPMCR